MSQQERKQGSRQSLVELEMMDDQFDEFPIGLGCALDLFREKDEVLELINALPAIYLEEKQVEVAYEKYSKIIDRYQEQPHLLDHHLEPMISLLLDQFRSSSSKESVPLKHLSLKHLRHLFKVRGPKEVVKRMPHEIADLVPVLEYLENENLDDPNTWESGYVLVMWLSILVINPFHLKLLDGEEQGKKNGMTIAERLMKVCKKCLVLNNNIGQAAPFLLSKFLTRPDMQAVYMDDFIQWACKSIHEPFSFGTRVGAFAGLSAIFKHAKRQEILKYGEPVLNAVLSSKYDKCDTVLRKLGTKLIQRIGMMFMKTKMAPWRYQRGSRSLLVNLKGATQVGQGQGGGATVPSESKEDYAELTQYSGAIESVLDKLLGGLKDKDTVVRWSSAKGIGRVTNRLPKDYADEVVEGILQNFSLREGNGAWHGGCLALAELARRGLLLPERVPAVIPVIKKAMVYDEIRGNFSVGAHVRDAACYVLWAFARAFEPNIIQPFVHDIATSLIITIVFDREVNCRRSASAAFQENVGRQGNFPHGIDIVTLSDYFSVGIRSNAFTKVSVAIGQYQVYTTAMIDHLLEHKYNHFDGAIRDLTANALGSLSMLEPEYAMEFIIPKLVPRCVNTDTYTSHGALISLGSVLVKLKSIDRLEINSKLLKDMQDIIPTIIKKKFNASLRGNDLIRQGVNIFIMSYSLSKVPFHGEDIYIDICHGVLEECIANLDARTRSTACDAFAAFLLEYYYKNPIKHHLLPKVLEITCTHLHSSTMTVRQGYARALGKLSIEILKEDMPTVLTTLIECCKITPQTLVWAESRRDAIYALANIFRKGKVTKSSDWNEGIPLELIEVNKVYDCLLAAMNDYTTDKRGDIGSWVRQAAMEALKILTIRLHECDPSGNVDPSIMGKTIGLVIKQCVEKIDNVRVHAGQIFSSLIHHKNPVLVAIPHREQVLKLFHDEFCASVNWRATSVTYPKFVEMLPLEQYTYSLLEGFVISGGSLSDSVMRDANGAITSYLIAAGAMGDGELHRIGKLLVEVFENNAKVDRVTVPLMKFVTQLLQSGTLLPLLSPGSDVFGPAVIELSKNEVLRSSRVEKIVTVVELLCEMLQGSTLVVKAAMKKLVVYLCHAYPRVRLVTSQKIYEALLTYGAEGLIEDSSKVDDVMSLLSETQWDSDVNVVRPVRNEICNILNIPHPVVLKASASNSGTNLI